jgi:MFS family permease
MAAIARTEAPPKRLLGIGAVWLSSGFTAAIPYALLPAAAILVAGRQADLLVGQTTAAGNLAVLSVPVLAGWLSDRTTTRWGRRTPWLIALAFTTVAGLLILGVASIPMVLVLGYLVYQCGASGQGGVFNAVLPDFVPLSRRGLASGVIATMAGVGGIAGLGIASGILLSAGEGSTGVFAGYFAIALVVLAMTAVTVLTLKERPSHPGDLPDRPTGSVIETIAQFGRALRSPDFAWSAANRALFNFGYFSVQPFVAFYFRDVGHSSHPSASSAIWGVLIVVAAVGPAIVGGLASDRLGRRKPFLYMSGVAQSIVVFAMIGLSFSYATVYLEALLFGVGYGLYYAVDLALACDVLPDLRAAGRDMGIWHAAYSVPAVLAPALAAPVLHFLNQPGTFMGIATGSPLGYRVVFTSSAVWFLLGTLAVARIRGVR